MPMAGHTMTLVDDIKVWVVGGFSSSSYFSESVFIYDAGSNRWTELTDLPGARPTGESSYGSMVSAGARPTGGSSYGLMVSAGARPAGGSSYGSMVSAGARPAGGSSYMSMVSAGARPAGWSSYG